jgi:glycosyltransferase involved in cell wall biosynthesis
MRIGIYDPYLDDVGGGEKYMLTIADCLSKHHQVDIFWGNVDDFEAVKKRFALDLAGAVLKKNIFSRNVGSLQRVWETRKYDVLIVLSDGSIPLVLSKKLFLHVQQPLDEVGFSSLKSKLKLSRVNAIFYNSEFTKSFNDVFIKGVKTEIIYPPVYIVPVDTQKQNIIMHVGRFRVANVKNEDYKKQRIMVDAFKQMVKKGLKNWKFVVATSIQNEKDVQFNSMLEAAEGFPIEFLINKSNDQLWESYHKAKIYWHASGFGEDLDKHPEYAEHFGISTVEAMGAGAVPVVINAGGQKEIVHDGENGFLWNTLEELEEKTKQLINDESLLKKMSERAKVRAQNFSKEKFCEDITKLIEN